MCGACYSGITDVVGTSAPFVAGGVAVARHRMQAWLPFGRSSDDDPDDADDTDTDDEISAGLSR